MNKPKRPQRSCPRDHRRTISGLARALNAPLESLTPLLSHYKRPYQTRCRCHSVSRWRRFYNEQQLVAEMHRQLRAEWGIQPDPEPPGVVLSVETGA
ncbi:MAG: hypothetical protein INR62_03215 [Rhodospirillales bacterium]|nr:hypothetical protein [Acetobacter sp.]